MNTKLLESLFFILIFFTTEVNARNIEWLNGYIVNLSNDTITGILGYRNGEGDWQECLFKETISSASTIHYTPEEILSYGYENGLTYTSKKVDVPSFNKKVFVETLLIGTIDLSYLKIANCPEHPDGITFYIAETTSGRMLRLDEDKNLKTGKLTKQQNIAKLKFLFDQYPELTPKIENIKIERESLINLFKDFHKIICSDFTCMTYKEGKSSRRWWITPRIGGSINHFETNGWNPGCTVGGYTTTNLSKFTNRFVLNIGLDFNLSPSYPYIVGYECIKKGWSYIFTNFFSLESRSMNGSVRPFFEIGLHQNYIIAREYKVNNPAGYYNLGIMAGTGIYLHLKKCEFPVRLQYYYGRKADMFTLTIGYTFKLK